MSFYPTCFLRVSAPLRVCVSQVERRISVHYGLFMIVLLASFLIGCNRGGDVLRVSGQLVKDGKPYGANLGGKEPETFVVDFVGTINERPYRFAATMKPDGSFHLGGSDGLGIPRGQY